MQEYARKDAEKDALFLQFVSGGMTRTELEKLIAKRPALWGRYVAWLDKLPIDKGCA